MEKSILAALSYIIFMFSLIVPPGDSPSNNPEGCGKVWIGDLYLQATHLASAVYHDSPVKTPAAVIC